MSLSAAFVATHVPAGRRVVVMMMMSKRRRSTLPLFDSGSCCPADVHISVDDADKDASGCQHQHHNELDGKCR